MSSYKLRVEDASPMWVYEPDAWTVENKSDQEPEKFLDPTSHATSQQGASATLRFYGNGITVFGVRGAKQGTYEVKLDNQTLSHLPLSVGRHGSPILFEKRDLSGGEHVLVLTNVGTNPESAWLQIDYASVSVGTGVESKRLQPQKFDDTWTNITYDHNFSLASNTFLVEHYYERTFHITGAENAQAHISFEGEAIALYGAISTNHDQFTVSLDGGPPISLTGRFDYFLPGTLLYAFTGLNDTNHTVTLTSTPRANGYYLDLDSVAVYGKNLPTSSVSSFLPPSTSTGLPIASPTESAISPESSSVSLSSSSSKSSAGKIAGGIIGGLILLALLLLAVVLILRRRNQRYRLDPVPLHMPTPEKLENTAFRLPSRTAPSSMFAGAAAPSHASAMPLLHTRAASYSIEPDMENSESLPTYHQTVGHTPQPSNWWARFWP